MPRGHSCARTAAAPVIPLVLAAWLLVPLTALSAGQAQAGTVSTIERCDSLVLADSSLSLGARYVVPGSLRLWRGDSLLPDSLYRLDNAGGRLTFLFPVPPGPLTARYRAWPFTFPTTYSLRPAQGDSLVPDSPASAVSFRPDSLQRGDYSVSGDAAEGFRLVGFDISGTKSVSVAGGGGVGGTTLDQNLSLEVAGRLSRTTSLRLRLNDQDLPLTAEGRSTELRELDEVSVQLNSPLGSVELGDYDFRLDGFRFAQVERKLDGVAGTLSRGGAGLSAAAALSGGTFNSLRFNAREGSQGPYQLTDKEGAPARVLIGTEHVYLDGRRLTRGARADYTIDYTQGVLYFTERHILGAESRIEVDYEYTSLSFKKSFYSLTGALDGKLGQVRGYFIRESDLESSPLGEDFTAEERAYLESLGVSADSLKFSGVRYLGTGKGEYNLRGDGGAGSWFEYAGPGGGDWMLTFRDVGDYRGSYVFNSSTGGYVFVGEGLGNFEPVGRFSPPQRQDRAGAAFEFHPAAHLSLSGEGAMLKRSLNLYSGAGLPAALAHSLGLSLDTLGLAALPGVRLTLRGEESRVGKDFTFQGRRYGPDFERAWNLSPLADGEDGSGVGENTHAANARLDLPRGLALTAGYGSLSRSNDEQAERREYGLEFRPARELEAAWQRLNVSSTRLAPSEVSSADSILSAGHRLRDNLSLRAGLGLFQPRLDLERERESGPASLYGSGSAGVGHLELKPRLSARFSPRFETGLTFYQRGNDYLPFDSLSGSRGDWRRESTVRATEADFSYQGRGSFRLSGRLGHRSRQFSRTLQERATSTAGRLEMFAGSFSGALQSHLLYEISHGSSLRSQVRYLPERYPDEGEYLADGTWVGREQGTHRREVIVGGIDPKAAATLSLTSRENIDLTGWVDTAATHIRRITASSTLQLERENTAVESWKLYCLLPSALSDKDGAVMRGTLINADLTVQWADPGVYSRLELLWNSRFDRRFKSGFEESGERTLRLQMRIPLARHVQWDPTPAWSRRARTNLNGSGRAVRSLGLENRLTWDITGAWRVGVEADAARHRLEDSRALYGRYALGGTLTRFLGRGGRIEAGGSAFRVTGEGVSDVTLVDILGLASSGSGYEATAGASVEPTERMTLYLRYTGRTDYLRSRFVNYGRAEVKYVF